MIISENLVIFIFVNRQKLGKCDGMNRSILDKTHRKFKAYNSVCQMFILSTF